MNEREQPAPSSLLAKVKLESLRDLARKEWTRLNLNEKDVFLPPSLRAAIYPDQDVLGTPRIESFDALLKASTDPLHSLIESRSTSAYSVFFFRDAIISLFQVLEQKGIPADERQLLVKSLTQVIVYTLSMSGIKDSFFPGPDGGYSGETVGGLVHEARSGDDPRAKEFLKRDGWGFPFYGVVDGNGLLLQKLVNYLDKTGDGSIFSQTIRYKDGRYSTVSEGLIRTINWILAKMEQTPHQLVQAFSPIETYNKVQAWQDERPGYPNGEGDSVAPNGFSAIEVHGQVYDALIGLEDLLGRVILQEEGDPLAQLFLQGMEGEDFSRKIDRLKQLQNRLKRKIHSLKKTLDQNLWDGEARLVRGFYWDEDETGDKELKRIEMPNTGLLWLLQTSYLQDEDKKEMVASIIKQTFNEDMMSPYGLRTITRDQIHDRFDEEGNQAQYGYNPKSYHRGSVWPMDQMEIAQGLIDQGYYGLARDLSLRVLATVIESGAFPEVVHGDSQTNQLSWTRPGEGDPHSQVVQTWTVSAALLAADYLERMMDGDLPAQAKDSAIAQIELECLHKLPELPLAVAEIAAAVSA